ncbi:MAG TPA: molybdopterin-dependent oxidoreductase, partial [Urbifossiella sp.]|nr:molybdopterin-dependent oxidoreductase [Urbifossiella sp.]
PAAGFGDVSRGNPKPYSLTGAAREAARLTPETWRLEITADPFVEELHTKAPAALARPLTLAAGTALDLPALTDLGKTHQVHFLKAMQCLNIDTPLGQGLWTGVPLRDVLRLGGRMTNVRRVSFRGYHNNDPKQIFQSSVDYTHALETPPGELPAFLAYRLNGEPISPERGGPVRMVVPWSYGFKSIKWLQQIFVTNNPRNTDTYAEGNNDPESVLKTAAYTDRVPEKFPAERPATFTGVVMCGPSGVRRVEYWVRRVDETSPSLADDAPDLLRAPWAECPLDPQPDWGRAFPVGVRPHDVLGFDRTTGRPQAWPLRYSLGSFTVTVRGLAPGRYEFRARAVDLNGFAQPEPRPLQKTGKNAIQVRRFEVG